MASHMLREHARSHSFPVPSAGQRGKLCDRTNARAEEKRPAEEKRTGRHRAPGGAGLAAAGD
eukprot:SAG31_NODE_12227_length_957_cov_1.325175_1_plen_61_part_10